MKKFNLSTKDPVEVHRRRSAANSAIHEKRLPSIYHLRVVNQTTIVCDDCLTNNFLMTVVDIDLPAHVLPQIYIPTKFMK